MDSLNVVFHGTFAFLDWKSALEVLVPIVNEHKYLGGTWKKEKKLVQGETYSLVGVNGATTNPPLDDLGIAVVRKGKKKVNRNSEVVFCSMLLPPPAQFVALRCYAPKDKAGNPIQEPIFQGKDATAATKAMTSYAACHVLIYQSPDVSAVTVPNLDWVPDVHGNVANLHIFAETSKYMEAKPGSAHRLEAFRQLVHVLNADLEIRAHVRKAEFGLTPCPVLQQVPGLDPAQTRSLAERKGAGGGGDPIDCASGGK